MPLNEPIQFLPMVKDRINVTFGHRDKDIERMITESMASIRSWTGSVDFNPEAEASDTIGILANEMLLDLVRYKWNGSGQYFMQEHRPAILTLQLEVAKRDKKKQTYE
jgi:hypothetical protein